MLRLPLEQEPEGRPHERFRVLGVRGQTLHDAAFDEDVMDCRRRMGAHDHVALPAETRRAALDANFVVRDQPRAFAQSAAARSSPAKVGATRPRTRTSRAR